MSYCSEITSEKIYNMTEQELNSTLDKCENCPRYSQCDTVALMLDELKLKNNEILKCPHCEHYQGFSDCPDLFYEDSDNNRDINEQLKLLVEMQRKGFNVVTCGNCGQVFIHRT